MKDTQVEILSVASDILFKCSVLPDSELKKKLATAVRDELFNKVFMVRPYWELFLEFTSKADFDNRRKDPIGIFDRKTSPQRESKEIGWIDSPGYGYTKKKSHGFIKNRYRRAIAPIRKTLLRLRASPNFNNWISKMRTEGYLDWQILLIISNQVMNYRVHLTEPTFHPERSKDLSIEFMNREELDTDPYFPEESLYDPQYSQSVFSSLIATTSTWDVIT